MNISRLFFCFIVFCFSCSKSNKTDLNLESIYDYVDNKIIGEPIRIEIFDKGDISYNIECDSLIKSEENILLFDNVNIQIFNVEGTKTTEIFSNFATIIGHSKNFNNKVIYNYSKGDMIAEGNVKIKSTTNNYMLLTNKIMVYNHNRCNIAIEKKEPLIFINNKDTLRGHGFESDCEMNIWKINNPLGIINETHGEN